MTRICLLMALAIVLPGFLPTVIPVEACLSLAALALVGLALRPPRPACWVCVAMLGFCWGAWYCQTRVAMQLDPALEGEDVWVRGQIATLVDTRDTQLRFQLRVDTAAHDGAFTAVLPNFPGRLALAWYRPPAWASSLDAGHELVLKLRLKRPRGFVNPGAFDYQLWLLRQGVGASGYVREAGANRRVDSGAPASVRARLRQWLLQFDLSHRDLLQALMFGDRSAISPGRWQLLRVTGTSHLVAISGLHIGLIAMLAYGLGVIAGRPISLVTVVRAQTLGGLLAVLAAMAYSALAGFSLPTQRACVMVIVLVIARLTGRYYLPQAILALALLGVVLLDPLAPYDTGFWLSFLAVATLMLVFQGQFARVQAPLPVRLWRPQWAVFVGLGLPLALAFGQVSLVAPLANVVAIPVVGFVVVPLVFLAGLAAPVAGGLAEWLLGFANTVLAWLFDGLGALAAGPLPVSTDIRLPYSSVPLAAGAVLLLLLPRALKLRVPGVMLLVVVLALPPPVPPPLALTVLDVGQGLAVVVRAGNRTLVYDTGPRFSERFDAGRDIVGGYLNRLGVGHIDTLVVSHGHADHAGGLAGLMVLLPVTNLYTGERLARYPGVSCHAIRDFIWGEVRFAFIAQDSAANAGNNSSCVLQIHYRNSRVLLTGDIEAAREPSVINAVEGGQYKAQPLTLLLAPHHGSRTSSSPALVQSFAPEHVVFSTGYKNRHGHPHPTVVARFETIGSAIYNTATDGALRFEWLEDGHFQVHSARRDAWGFWY